MPDQVAPEQEVEGVSVPSEAPETPRGTQPASGPSLTDIRDQDDILGKCRMVLDGKLRQFQADRDDLEEVWSDADFMWGAGLDATKRAADQTDDTEADTASTLFYQQVRTLASLDLDVIFSRPGESPLRYIPTHIENVPFSEEDASQITAQRQGLLRYTMKIDDFARKFIEADFQLTKYGNQPVMIWWRRRVARRWVKDPILEDGRIKSFRYARRDVVTDDHPELWFPSNNCFYADRHIADLQAQQAVFIEELADITEIWARATSGEYSGVEDIEAKHKWVGATDAEDSGEFHEEHQEHRGLEAGDDSQTGTFKLIHAWGKVPVSEDGEWSPKDTAPKWFLFTFVHNIKDGPCIRAIENTDPDNEFPGFMWHRNPDDSDLLYHISDAQVLKPNYDEATTRKNQYFDNLTQINRRLLLTRRGNGFTDDWTYRNGGVVQVKDPTEGGVRELNVLDTSQTMLQCLQYIDDDSRRATGTDRPVVGEALGGRTSATEAQNVNAAATRPHSVLIRYHLEQFLMWYGRKVQRYWEQWGDPERVLAITDQNELLRVDLGKIFGDFDVEVQVIQEFENDLLDRQNLSFVMQSVIPNFMDILQPVGKRALLAKILRHFKTNPRDIIPEHTDQDAEFTALTRLQGMLMEGVYEPPAPGENHTAHLRVAEGVKLRFAESEDPEIAVRVGLVDDYIADLRALMGGGNGGSLPAAPGNETPGEVAGNAIAGRNPASNIGNLPFA